MLETDTAHDAQVPMNAVDESYTRSRLYVPTSRRDGGISRYKRHDDLESGFLGDIEADKFLLSYKQERARTGYFLLSRLKKIAKEIAEAWRTRWKEGTLRQRRW